MRTKILSKQALLIVMFLGSVLFVIPLLNLIPIDLSKDIPVQEQAVVGLPIFLKIPAIEVDSPVVPVEVTSDGAMDVPKGPVEVAWYSLGSRPGENGSAVIAGHFGWKNNIPAVFDNLHKLQIGDKVYTQDEKGVEVAFVVREIRKYRDNEFAPDVFLSSDGKAHLNLVTCSGSWNVKEKTRPERLVVFTDKE